MKYIFLKDEIICKIFMFKLSTSASIKLDVNIPHRWMIDGKQNNVSNNFILLLSYSNLAELCKTSVHWHCDGRTLATDKCEASLFTNINSSMNNQWSVESNKKPSLHVNTCYLVPNWSWVVTYLYFHVLGLDLIAILWTCAGVIGDMNNILSLSLRMPIKWKDTPSVLWGQLKTIFTLLID